jgi:hypothetical protein
LHDHELALLSFRGRRTGRPYTVPVAYHELDDEPLILTSSGWKANLRGGADVEFLHEGRRVPMRAELIEEAEEVGRVYEALLQRDGLEHAKPTRIGLEVEGDRIPTCEEIARAVGGRRARGPAPPGRSLTAPRFDAPTIRRRGGSALRAR